MKFLPILMACLMAGAAFAATQPNVVLVITDDQGYGDLGCNMATRGRRRPHLDKLHADERCG